MVTPNPLTYIFVPLSELVRRAYSLVLNRPDQVRISQPSLVTRTVCSHCADIEPSPVTTVQRSFRVRQTLLPALRIGSMARSFQVGG